MHECVSGSMWCIRESAGDVSTMEGLEDAHLNTRCHHSGQKFICWNWIRWVGRSIFKRNLCNKSILTFNIFFRADPQPAFNSYEITLLRKKIPKKQMRNAGIGLVHLNVSLPTRAAHWRTKYRGRQHEYSNRSEYYFIFLYSFHHLYYWWESGQRQNHLCLLISSTMERLPRRRTKLH